MLNLEMFYWFRIRNSTALLVPKWVQTCCSSSAISFEDQVCQNTGYDCMFGDIALDVLSVLGHLNLTLQVSFVCPFVVIDPADLGATAEFQALCLSIRQWPEVYDSCHTFLHVARVKKPTAMRESRAILAPPQTLTMQRRRWQPAHGIRHHRSSVVDMRGCCCLPHCRMWCGGVILDPL